MIQIQLVLAEYHTPNLRGPAMMITENVTSKDATYKNTPHS